MTAQEYFEKAKKEVNAHEYGEACDLFFKAYHQLQKEHAEKEKRICELTEDCYDLGIVLTRERAENTQLREKMDELELILSKIENVDPDTYYSVVEGGK
jgi:hypothetical protein